MADNELEELIYNACQENLGRMLVDPQVFIAAALLDNPAVVARSLIAAGHASLSLMDGTPVYLIEVKEPS